MLFKHKFSVRLSKNIITGTLSTFSLIGLLQLPALCQTILSKNLSTDRPNQFSQSTFNCTVESDRDIQTALGLIQTKTGQISAAICIEHKNDVLNIIVFTKDKTIKKEVSSVSLEELRSTINLLQQNVADERKKNSDRYKEPAQKLYNWLIQPVKNELDSKRVQTLIFSINIDAPSFPLEVLYDGKQFIIEHYSISRIFKIDRILKIAQDLEIQNETSLQNLDVLVMGTSKFKDVSTSLVGIENELYQVGGSWNRSSNTEYLETILGEEFTRDKVREKLHTKSFEIIHIATHGVFNRENPEHSYLSLWDDRLLFDELKELLRDRDIEILVLSACGTASATEDGKFGLEQFASDTNIKTIIASQWSSTNNFSAYLMMTRFPLSFFLNPSTSRSQLYGFRKAEALRKVQLRMLRKDLYLTPDSGELSPEQVEAIQQELERQNNNEGVIFLDHPYYWAAFTLVGSPW